MPNAIAALDKVSDVLHARVRARTAISPVLPSIVSSFMPKSGGTFLFNRLVHDCGYVEYHWSVSHPQALHAAYAVPRALRNYLRGGCVSHTHYLPSPHNLAVLEGAGVRKVWVHVRHPCEVVQSAYHHYAGEGHGDGEIARERSEQAVREATELGLDVDVADRRKRTAFFRAQIPWVVDWLRMWVLHAAEHPGFVHFTSHRDLRDPVELLNGVFAAFGVPRRLAELPAHRPQDRRRRGQVRDWRHGLDDDAIGEAVTLIESRLAPARWVRDLCGLEG